MKPKELLITRLQEHIVPFMEERGFRFSKSRVHFTRKVGQVCQNIALCSDRYNTADNGTFWTMWSANAPEYLEWYRKQWSDEKPSGDTLGDLADWNIPGWSRGPAGPRYTLTNTAKDAAVSESFQAISRMRDCLGWSAFQLGKARPSTFGSSAGGTTRLRISSSSPDAWRKHTL